MNLKTFCVLFCAIPLYSMLLPSEPSSTVVKIAFQDQHGNKIDRCNVGVRLLTKTGRPFSKDTLNADIKSLYEKCSIVEPKIDSVGSDRSVSILFTIAHRKKIKDIHISPNTVLKVLTKDKIIDKFGLKEGDLYNKDTVYLRSQVLKEWLLSKGFYTSKVNTEYKHYTDNNVPLVDITLNIDLGNCYYIRSVSHEGLSDDDIIEVSKHLLTKSYNPIVSRLSGYGYYFHKLIERDRMWLITFLRNQGYSDCKVTYKTIFSEDRPAVKVVFVVTKGDLYSIRYINIESHKKEQLYKIIGQYNVSSNAPFSPQNIKTATESIKYFLGCQGNIEPHINVKSQLSSFSQRLYDLYFTVESGDIFKIGRIRVQGNVSTNTDVILRKCVLVPGDTFNSFRMTETQMLLTNTRLFESVSIYPRCCVDLYPDERELVIEVKERPTGTLGVSCSKNLNEGWQASLNVNESNFNLSGLCNIHSDGTSALRGAGEYLSASVSIGMNAWNHSISFFKPSLMRSSIGWGIDISKYSSMPGMHQIKIAQHSVKNWLSKTLNHKDSIEVAVKVTSLNCKTPDRSFNPTIDTLQITSDMESEVCGQFNILGTSCTVRHNGMRNIKHPMKGWNFLSSCELLSWNRIGSASNILKHAFKVQTSSSWYMPLKTGTIKAKCELDFISALSNGIEEVPYTERLFGNDPSSCRGWKSNSLGYRFVTTEGIETSSARGGDLFGLLSVEYAMPMTSDFDLFLFYDLLTLRTIFDYSSVKRPHHGDVQTSIGYGFRVHSFMGMPLALGFGYPIFKPDRSEDVSNFFFSLSGNF